MILRTLMLLAATAMAVLLAGCGGSRQEDGSLQQQSDATNIDSAGGCADYGSADLQQEGSGVVSNGKLAFERLPDGGPPPYEDIYVIDEDGTNETRLTQTDSDPQTRTNLGLPVWSPDGNKIAFSSSAITVTPPSSDSPESAGASTAPAAGITGIYVIDVDTAGICKLTSTAAEYQVSASPTWSPDGNKIAFYDKNAINVTNTDGSGLKKLTDTVPALSAHAWSPEGERIAFVKQSDLYVINADGTGLKRLANTVNTIGSEGFPAWSLAWAPDGEKIAFPCPVAPGGEGHDLCVINADGTE